MSMFINYGIRKRKHNITPTILHLDTRLPDTTTNISLNVKTIGGNNISVRLNGKFEENFESIGLMPNSENILEIWCNKDQYDLDDYIFGDILESKNLITSTKIGNQVRTLRTTFKDCKNLEYLTISSGLVNLGNNTFQNCVLLSSVTVPDSVTNIGASVFQDCVNLENIHVSENNEYYKSVDGVLFNKDLTELIQYSIGNSRANYSVPDSLISIGNGAFSNCGSLENVIFGENSQLTSIGSSAFFKCISLESVIIPNSVTSMGVFLFSDCVSLTNINISSGITKINPYTFQGCISLENIIIPDSVTNIGAGAFRNCSSLETITVPHNVLNISWEVFMGCVNLSEVIIKSETPPALGVSVFTDTSNTLKIFVPSASVDMYRVASGWIHQQSRILSATTFILETTSNSGTSIPIRLIKPNTNTLYIEVNGNMQHILDGSVDGQFQRNIEIDSEIQNVVRVWVDQYDYSFASQTIGTTELFRRDVLKEVFIGSQIEIIESFAFNYSRNLEYVVIPNGITSIGGYAFSSTNLKNIIIPDSVLDIGNLSFNGCRELENVILSKNLTVIGVSAFRYCERLLSVIIPASVTDMGNTVFSYCRKLKTVIIENTTPPIIGGTGTRVFSYTHETLTIYVPSQSEDVYKNTSFWDIHSDKIYSKDIIDNEGFAIQNNVLIQYIGTETNISIPNSVGIIRGRAFQDMNTLTHIDIPNSVMMIADRAFDGCTVLENIFIPNSVSILGSRAFMGCESLKTVVFGSNSSITILESSLFAGCLSLHSIIIPSSVTTFGGHVFSGCSSLIDVRVKNTTPPVVGMNIFSNHNDLLKIYVPSESVDAYKISTGWSSWANRIYAIQ